MGLLEYDACNNSSLSRERVYRVVTWQRQGATQTDRNTRPRLLILYCVFIAAGTCLLSRCLAIKGYTLSSLCLATVRGINIQSHRLMEGIYEVRRWDRLRCHGIHTEFHKDWFTYSNVNMWGFTYTLIHRQTDRQHGDRISLLSFLQNKESGRKSSYEKYYLLWCGPV
jgi:hypothetical protein